MSRILVFAGPTLEREQILEIVPQSEVYAPIGANDLLQFVLNPGDLVAIIDGFFYQSAAVRHKEILDLLYRGVHVWGASSMGALRAAELAPFGMRGFGRIFEAYVQGKIEGDDEVALFHAPEEMGYVMLTEALVNVRYACECAVAAGVITPAVQQKVVATAASLPFNERSYPAIFKHAVDNGLSRHDADVLHAFVHEKKPNLKQNDALELLQALRHPPSEPLKPSFEWHETVYIRSWRIHEQRTYFNDEQWVADTDVLTAYQLFSHTYPDTHAHLLQKTLTTIAARSLNHEVPTGDICNDLIARYLSIRLGLSVEGPLPPCISRWLRPEEKELSSQEQLVKVAVRLWHMPRGFDWHQVMISYLKTNDVFNPLVRVVAQARAINEKIWGPEAMIRTSRLPADRVHTWFSQRWGVEKADLEFAVLDRGFRGITDFTKKACFFYMLDNIVGVKL